MYLLAASFRQAAMNWYHVPAAKLRRASGLEIETSIFPAPLIDDIEDFEAIRLRQFQGQYSDSYETSYAWDQLDTRPVDHFAKAVARLIAPSENVWSVDLFNTLAADNGAPMEGKTLSLQTIEPILFMQCFEALAAPNDRHNPLMIEDQLAENGQSYPETHIRHVTWALEGQCDQGVKGEMISRKMNALVYGRDLRGNFSFKRNGSKGTILSPNLYHHF